MSDGRGQIFAMRANLLRRFAGAQECRNAAVAARVEYVARMAIVERINGCDIDEHHRMCPCNRADGAQMPFLQRMLLGGDDDQRLFVPNAARVFHNASILRGLVHSRCNAVSKVRSNCARPPLNGTRVMEALSPNTMDTSSPRRRLSAANMHKAFAAT